jgi:hypothetical protein
VVFLGWNPGQRPFPLSRVAWITVRLGRFFGEIGESSLAAAGCSTLFHLRRVPFTALELSAAAGKKSADARDFSGGGDRIHGE